VNRPHSRDTGPRAPPGPHVHREDLVARLGRQLVGPQHALGDLELLGGAAGPVFVFRGSY
jgi:hypothetical protein